jgi:hypothetical protein
LWLILFVVEHRIISTTEGDADEKAKEVPAFIDLLSWLEMAYSDDKK